jgi:hypothetical protein
MWRGYLALKLNVPNLLMETRWARDDLAKRFVDRGLAAFLA